MIKQFSAGIIVYRQTQEGPKFLLLYHGKSYWNFPKGKIEETEKSFRAALRELKEETGLKKSDLVFGDFFRMTNRYFFTKNGQKVFKTVIFYLAETRKSKIIISDEHQGYAWFTYREALKMIKHKNLKPLLKKAYDLIRFKDMKNRVFKIFYFFMNSMIFSKTSG